MNSLIVDQPATYANRIFVKTTIRKTKSDGKKRIFVKTTVRGMTVEIEMDVDAKAVNLMAMKSEAAEQIIRTINSVKGRIMDNEPVRILVEMEFDPVPGHVFEELSPGPYSPHIISE